MARRTVTLHQAGPTRRKRASRLPGFGLSPVYLAQTRDAGGRVAVPVRSIDRAPTLAMRAPALHRRRALSAPALELQLRRAYDLEGPSLLVPSRQALASELSAYAFSRF